MVSAKKHYPGSHQYNIIIICFALQQFIPTKSPKKGPNKLYILFVCPKGDSWRTNFKFCRRFEIENSRRCKVGAMPYWNDLQATARFFTLTMARSNVSVS